MINGQQSHIKCSSTQVENYDIFFFILLVQSIRDGSCSWLVYYPLDLQTCDSSCILGCLPLCIVKVRWDSHHGMLHFLSQECLCCFFHFS
mmetsp:Transcript_25456/g.36488  ORF Transcript_25456/g.36488 Transcript_25456/m.36488 type:complete len:90 (-) Transcript_25456:711-980(-)